MKKYLSFFRLRFHMGLQYRAAAIAGCVTQFFWGGMLTMIFSAFYRTDASAFPMTLEATITYIWLQQAFLAFYMAWMMENEIFDSIVDGTVGYDLVRPVSVYRMWFARSLANRLSRGVLRCMPILLFAALLPSPYGIMAPAGITAFLWFLLSMVLGLFVTVALCMLIYMLTFFTISPQGLRILFLSFNEFFAGGLIPIPFFPDRLRTVMELLPFASQQNTPLRIYSGDITGQAVFTAVALQLFWLIVLLLSGELLWSRASKKITLQGS
jgi:ABC-2 type transport system permease protein